MPAKSIETIKRHAKRLKKESHGTLQHCDALDASARAAGFENFRHARAALLGNNEKGPTA